MKEISESIIHSAVMSGDEKYRFLLKRVWDKGKQNATLIMLNPSKANLLKSDMTITNTMNYLMDKEFGSMSVEADNYLKPIIAGEVGQLSQDIKIINYAKV